MSLRVSLPVDCLHYPVSYSPPHLQQWCWTSPKKMTIRKLYLESQFLCPPSQYSLISVRLKFLLLWSTQHGTLHCTLAPSDPSSLFWHIAAWHDPVTLNLKDHHNFHLNRPFRIRTPVLQKMLKNICPQKCIESTFYQFAALSSISPS